MPTQIQVKQIDPRTLQTFRNLLRREGRKTQIFRIGFVLRLRKSV